MFAAAPDAPPPHDHSACACTAAVASVFWFAFISLSFLVLLNVLVAIIYDSFTLCVREHQEVELFLRRYDAEWERIDVEGRGCMEYADFGDLLLCLPARFGGMGSDEPDEWVHPDRRTKEDRARAVEMAEDLDADFQVPPPPPPPARRALVGPQLRGARLHGWRMDRRRLGLRLLRCEMQVEAADMNISRNEGRLKLSARFLGFSFYSLPNHMQSMMTQLVSSSTTMMPKEECACLLAATLSPPCSRAVACLLARAASLPQLNDFKEEAEALSERRKVQRVLQRSKFGVMGPTATAAVPTPPASVAAAGTPPGSEAGDAVKRL